MSITRITNNIILDGTILPAKLNVSANLRTFLGDATSANLAGAVSGTTGSGNLVFATNPTLTNLTISGTGIVATCGTDPAVVAVGTPATTGAFVGGYYTAGGSSSTIYFGQNSYFSGSAWVQPNTAKNSATFVIQNNVFTFYTQAAGNANNSIGSIKAVISASGMSIGSSAPNTKAALDLQSTTQGFLPPRMTLSNRTTLSSSGTVPEGLIVYTTDNALKSKTITLYNGSDWDSVLTTRADSFTTSDLAAALSDGETGSGQLVLATNPTLSGANVTGTLAVTDSITIGGVAAAKVVDPVRTTLTGDGTTDTFAISGATGLTNPSALLVAVDGSLQEPGADYSISGGNIIFTSPLESGAKAVVISPVNTVQVGQVVPSDGSVTSAKIANSVTLTTPSLVGPVNLTGQDASAADRIMTRDLVDSRTIIATLPSNLTVNDSASYNATSMVLSLTAGWWEINGEFRIDSAVGAAGSKLYLAFTGSLPEAYSHRIWIASVSSGSNLPSLLYNNPTYGSGTQPFLLSQSIASTTVGIFKVGPSLIYLTANATITVGFSQNTANASNTTMYAFPFSRIWATRLKY